MKKVYLSLLALAFAGATQLALAGPPECVPPGLIGKDVPPGKAKVTLLHCGCADDGLSLVYREIQVSNRSKGHRKHVAGSFDSCSDDGETYRDFVRTGSDCQVDGPAMGDDIAFCDGQIAGDECGSEVID